MGGEIPPTVASTEEFSAPAVFNQIQEGQLYFNSTANAFKETLFDVPAGTYAAGGSLNTARGYHGGAGLQTAGIVFGGTDGTTRAFTESYDGSSWTEVADLNTARGNVSGFGTSTAAIAANGSTPTKAETESWNGSSWTEIAELNTYRSDSAASGASQTSGMVATGTPVPGNPAYLPGGASKVTEIWDGSSWTEVGDTNTKRLQSGMSVNGPTTNSIIASGEDGPGSVTVNAESWDGSSWTEVNNVNTARGSLYNFGGTGSQAIMAGGYTPSPAARVAISEIWDGTSWTEGNDMSTGRNGGYGLGVGTASMHCGGITPPYTNAVEEYTAPLTNKTITAS